MRSRQVGAIVFLAAVFLLGPCGQCWADGLLPHMHAVKKAENQYGDEVLGRDGLKTCIAYAHRSRAAQEKLTAVRDERKKLQNIVRKLDKQSDAMGPVHKLKGEKRNEKIELVMRARQLSQKSLEFDQQYKKALSDARAESAPYNSTCIAKKYYESDYESLTK